MARHEAGGPIPHVPAILGQFEIGRSGKPWFDNHPSAAFQDGMVKGLVTELTGDPGAYEPFAYANLGEHAMRKVPRAFDSTGKRDMKMTHGKTDSPGAVYNITDRKYNHKLDPKVSSVSANSFRSKSDQRPSSVSKVPGAGTYSPNMFSVYARPLNAGASFRSKGARLHKERSMTEDFIGPGTYSAQYDGSIYANSQRSSSRSSRKQPGFGSTLPQRPIPFSARPRESPGPGAYDAFEPRTKDRLRFGTKAAFRSPGSHSYRGSDRPQSARAAVRV